MNDEDPFPIADGDGVRVSKRATGPSRSERRRDALDVLQLAHQLMDATPGLLPKLAMDDDLAALLDESRRIRQHIARKRQTQFLAKHLRRLDDDVLAGFRAVLEQDRDHGRRESAVLHRLEAWRERLLTGGDEALSSLLERYPDADRTRLRQLVRQAARERAAETPSHAYRELLRALRELDDGMAHAGRDDGD